MATAKKIGIVDKVKNAIGEMFSSSPAPAKKTAKASAKKVVAKKVVAKKAAKKAVAKTASKKTAAKKVPAKTAAKKAFASKKGMAQDRKLIALSEPYEVRDWCKSLGCTEAELTAAVGAVGHSAAKVRAYLKKP